MYNDTKLQVRGYITDGREGAWEVDRYPDECPICQKGNEFKPLYAFYKPESDAPWEMNSARLQVVFRCSRLTCLTMFFGIYTGNYLYLKETGVIMYFEGITFPDPIPTLSPRFRKIYSQAKIAEENSLDEIAGMAYGKSIEILIKDYLIHQNPVKIEDIKKEHKLAKLIDEIDDPDLAAVAKRAAWLRNDETHYVRKWIDQDISDLKQLIELTVSYIRRAYLTGKYKKEMPDTKEQKDKMKENKSEESKPEEAKINLH